MKPFLFSLLLLPGIAAFAGNGVKKTAVKKAVKKPVAVPTTNPALDSLAQADSSATDAALFDTTGMGAYGMRMYDVRMGRYMSINPGQQGQQPRPNTPYKPLEKPKAVKPKKG